MVSRNLYNFVRVIGRTDARRWFWADQISMDQSNIQERNHQVARMGQIYSGAEEVFAQVRFIERSEPLPRASLGFYLRLCASEYWKRLWIVQELRLAQKICLWLDDVLWPAETLLSKIQEDIEWVTATGRSELRLIQSLLQPRDEQGQLTLVQALRSFASGGCADRRDKLFGLQAMVLPEERIPADYSMPVGMVLYEVHRRLVITDWQVEKHLGRLQWPRNAGHVASSEVSIRLRRSLEVAVMFEIGEQTDPQEVAWCHTIALFSKHIPYPLRGTALQTWWISFWEDLRSSAKTSKQMNMAQDILISAETSLNYGHLPDLTRKLDTLSACAQGYIRSKTRCTGCGSIFAFASCEACRSSDDTTRDKKQAELPLSSACTHFNLRSSECLLCYRGSATFDAFLGEIKLKMSEIVLENAAKHGFRLIDEFLYHDEGWPLNIKE